MTKIRPLADRLYVERIEANQQTASGLYIPKEAQEKGQTGTVRAVGTKSDFQVKVGDVVYFGKYAGTEVDETHIILKEEDILGIVEQ